MCLKTALLAGVALMLPLAARPAAADTLLEAMSMAYQGNPNLLAARAQLRATDLATGQSLIGNFTIVRNQDGSQFITVIPDTATITGSSAGGGCSAGAVVDYRIYGGTPPYRVTSSFPGAVAILKSQVGNDDLNAFAREWKDLMRLNETMVHVKDKGVFPVLDDAAKGDAPLTRDFAVRHEADAEKAASVTEAIEAWLGAPEAEGGAAAVRPPSRLRRAWTRLRVRGRRLWMDVRYRADDLRRFRCFLVRSRLRARLAWMRLKHRGRLS